MITTANRCFRRVAALAAGACFVAIAATGTAYAALSSKPAQTWGTNGRINAILPVGDQVFLGGTFSAVVDTSGKTYPASNLAVISAASGAVDLTWQGSANNTVSSLATANGKLFIGGSFSKVDGATRNKLAAVSVSSGALDPSWTPSADAPVDNMAVGNSSVYAVGGFTSVTDASGAHSQQSVAKLDQATGAVDTAWTPTPNPPKNSTDARARAVALSSDGSKLYVGGDFGNVSGAAKTSRLAAVSATGTGSVITGFASQPNNGTSTAPIFDLTTNGSTLYEAVAGGGGACTAVDGSTGTQIWSKHANGNLQSVRYSSGIVYCGGHFSGTGSFDGLTRSKLAAVSATSPFATTSFAPTINSALGVWSLGADASHLFVGGDFTKVSGVACQHYAEFVDSGAQTVPSAPNNLSARAGDSVVHLSWAPPASDGGSPILRYAVYRHDDSTTNFGAPIAKVSSGTTYDDTTVTDGTTYTYAVSAINGVGEGPMSNQVQATPQVTTQTAPDAPTGLTATAGSAISLNWTAPANDGNSPITGYNIYRSTTSGAEQKIASTGTATSYTDSTVTIGTTYFYQVTAVNAIGESPRSNEASATAAAGVPSAPTLSGSVSGGVVHLTWTVPTSDGGSPITKYVVTRDGQRLVTLGPSVLSYDDSTATAGVAHVYQVKAVNAIGGGKLSNKVTLTP